MAGTYVVLREPLSNTANTLPGLRSEVSNQRLEKMASLRGRGTGERVDLPQLVVCGVSPLGRVQSSRVSLDFRSLDQMDCVPHRNRYRSKRRGRVYKD